ncbi:MAG: FliA/WhiG family RNA polymerase sigma factor [Planctomycetota bacterium]|jgi:RNA polymerase sigma factor for flagellar operon FliA
MGDAVCRELDEAIEAGIDLKTTKILWLKYRAENSENVRNELIEKYLPLVRSIADKIAAKLPSSVDSQDLQSAGIFGLMHAIRGFDLERGVRFETYCVNRIRGAILDELRQLDWVPRVVRSRANRFESAERDLMRELGRKPTPREIANHLDLPLKDVESLLCNARPRNMVSLNNDLPENDDNKAFRKLDFLEDKRSVDPLENTNRQELIGLISQGLSREERLVLLLYYYEQLTMKEIGFALDVTESRVCQIHAQILEKLRRRLGRRKDEFII